MKSLIISLSVTPHVRDVMIRHPEVNWSRVFRDAVEAKRTSLERDWLHVGTRKAVRS